jgi:hypothetical protein
MVTKTEDRGMSKYAFYIAYDGPALESNEMPVRDLAPALLAWLDAFDEANKIINGDDTEIRLNVKASFKTGCFGIDLIAVQDIKRHIANFFQGMDIASAADIATLLGINAKEIAGLGVVGLLAVLRFIGGKKIEKIEVEGKNATVYVGDKFLKTEKRVIRLLQNQRIRKAVHDAVYTPLSREGITTFAFTEKDPEKGMEEIASAEAESFRAPEIAEELINDTEYETSLQRIGPSFQEGNKWKFSDGSSPFFADIKDNVFLDRVDNHLVVFAKGDILTVKMNEIKRLTKDGMKADRTIIKVLDHRHASLQLPLPIVEKSE